MRLLVFGESGSRLPVKRIRRLFSLIVEEEADPDWQSEVNLIFTTDNRMRSLNREFRGKNQSTDVLSFNIESPVEAGNIFGEIYISVPIAARQAKRAGRSVLREYLRLSCHGLLHLFGYDHEKGSDAAVMLAREDHFLAGVRAIPSC